MRATPWKSSGFTLIELMVTIVIAAILFAIAVPMYTQQLIQSRRTDARTALLDLASREERYMSTNSAYSNAPASLGYSGAWPITVGGGYYQITAATTATTFLLTAAPVAGTPQAKDKICANFTLDNTGSQQVTGSAKATPSTCWN